jgi:PqqD family protein of HPr-rel-A system
VALLKPKVREGLTVVVLDGEAVVYDDRTGNLHHLNPAATVVFSLCDGSATVRELSTDIAETFGVRAHEVERQIRSLLRKFRRSELLEPARGGRG